MKFKQLSFLLLMGATLLTQVSCGEDEDPMEPGDNCSTADLTYTNYAGAVLNSNCATSGCHGEGTVSTFEMYNYETTSFAVSFGRIVGAISHQEGFSPMPKGGDMLAECDIEKLTQWIADGAPE